MKPIEKKRQRHARRKRHVRKKVAGTPDRPRLTVFRSHANIYAQIIKAVGTSLAERAIQAGIKKIVFDRNGYAYHGRLRELAQAAREGGLEF